MMSAAQATRRCMHVMFGNPALFLHFHLTKEEQERKHHKRHYFLFFPFFFKGYKQNTQIMFGKNEWSMLSLRMDCPSQRALAKMIEINDSVHGTETSNRKKKCGTRISRRECTSASTVRYNHAFRCMRQRQRKRS